MEIAYLHTCLPRRDRRGADIENVGSILDNYQEQIRRAFGGRAEEDAKEVVTEDLLRHQLACSYAETIELTGQSPTLLNYEIVGRDALFVALVEKGEISSVIDRSALAKLVARHSLQMAV